MMLGLSNMNEIAIFPGRVGSRGTCGAEVCAPLSNWMYTSDGFWDAEINLNKLYWYSKRLGSVRIVAFVIYFKCHSLKTDEDSNSEAQVE